MKNPDSVRRSAPGSGYDYDDGRYDDFHETLAPAVPTRTYRSAIVVEDARPGFLEQLVRVVTGVLAILLGVRFVINLFGGFNTTPLANLMNYWSNWAVAPFQALIGRPGSGVGGFFDWPALVALVVLFVVASVLT